MTQPTGFLADTIRRQARVPDLDRRLHGGSMLCGMAASWSKSCFSGCSRAPSARRLVPLSQAVLLNINPKERQGAAMAYWGMAIMIGPIIGPVLGGWLTYKYSWRWVFYINVPIGVLAFVGMTVFLPETAKHPGKVRLVRLRYFERGDRRIADTAGPRRGARLVRLRGNPHCGGDQRVGLLGCSWCTPSRPRRLS